MITTLLWDVDGTLLDFKASEKAAMKAMFPEFGFGECTDKMVEIYSAINLKYWEMLERQEINKPQVLVGRFEEFFNKVGADISKASQFNELYQLRLGDTIVYCDDCLQILMDLKGRVRQYAVSNGTVKAQTKKLKRSGLDKIMDGIFLSEDIGVEKPDIRFFEKVFESIRCDDRSGIMIVGDSLTSDIRGGNLAGIRTCWYNPAHADNLTGEAVDVEISDLHEIYNFI